MNTLQAFAPTGVARYADTLKEFQKLWNLLGCPPIDAQSVVTAKAQTRIDSIDYVLMVRSDLLPFRQGTRLEVDTDALREVA